MYGVGMRVLSAFAGFCAVVLSSASALAVDADPSNYLSLLGQLKPGDTMNLAPGTYTGQLQISGLNGTATAPITIAGPETAVFTASDCCNTVEFVDSSYVVVRGITLDGQGIDGPFGVSAKGGAENFTHHITIEGLTIIGYGAAQASDGISTKTPTWGWVIRGNKIIGAGTGLYLGNSDGSDAFFDGLIEGNLVKDPEGYCMQIKQQNPRPARDGQPTTDSRTIIRNNVFIKTDRPSGDGDRPNLLVDGFPESGPGVNDRYEIYGNFLFHNPRESLLQVSGRVSIHDNVFVDVADTAILLSNHNRPLQRGDVYNNTIYGAKTGIAFGNAATDGDAVIGNLVFATTGIAGSIANKKDNLELSMADAPSMVKNPTSILGAMDFYPLPGKCTGTELDLSVFAGDSARDVDFNGTPKTPPVYRGAYHGSGTNPGWALGDGLKTPTSTPAADGGVGDAASPDASTSTDSGAKAELAAVAPESDSGCGCRVADPGGSVGGLASAFAAVSALLVRSRRRRGRVT